MALVASGVILLATLSACERDMTISVRNESNVPSFKLSGSGRLVFFTVFEVPRDRPPSINDPKLWEIRPNGENRISALPEITYGVVPPGFHQTIPTTGSPPPLVEGRLYQAGGPAAEANGGSIRFTFSEGKVLVEPSVP
jgi:hypothetical protein